MSRKRQGGKLVRPGSKKTKKAKVAVDQKTKEEEEVPLTRFQSESEDSDGDESQVGKVSKDSKTIQSKGSWTNKQRVLIFGCRGIGFRDRHLMDDLRTLMPHSRTDSKMQRKDTLFVVNEIAEMKNCNKCLLFEGRKGRKDLYLWASNIARGPSAKFLVENVHTMAELKMTGNCLKSSRPLLSFDKNFDAHPHLAVLKELFTQIFSVPNHHPKSQPFFDHVYTFAVVDDKIWFRNYQILTEEDGSLAEIGPRFVLNPIKVFESSFCGQTLWENPKYVTPTAHRSMMKRMKAGKYRDNVQSKAAYEASRPTESTYDLDPTDEVFANDEAADQEKRKLDDQRVPLKLRKRKKKVEQSAAMDDEMEETEKETTSEVTIVENDNDDITIIE